MFPFGSEPFVRLREQFWISVFADAAARTGLYSDGSPDDLETPTRLAGLEGPPSFWRGGGVWPDRGKWLGVGGGGEVALVQQLHADRGFGSGDDDGSAGS